MDLLTSRLANLCVFAHEIGEVTAEGRWFSQLRRSINFIFAKLIRGPGTDTALLLIPWCTLRREGLSEEATAEQQFDSPPHFGGVEFQLYRSPHLILDTYAAPASGNFLRTGCAQRVDDGIATAIVFASLGKNRGSNAHPNATISLAGTELLPVLVYSPIPASKDIASPAERSRTQSPRADLALDVRYRLLRSGPRLVIPNSFIRTVQKLFSFLETASRVRREILRRSRRLAALSSPTLTFNRSFGSPSLDLKPLEPPLNSTIQLNTNRAKPPTLSTRPRASSSRPLLPAHLDTSAGFSLTTA